MAKLGLTRDALGEARLDGASLTLMAHLPCNHIALEADFVTRLS